MGGKYAERAIKSLKSRKEAEKRARDARDAWVKTEVERLLAQNAEYRRICDKAAVTQVEVGKRKQLVGKGLQRIETLKRHLETANSEHARRVDAREACVAELESIRAQKQEIKDQLREEITQKLREAMNEKLKKQALEAIRRLNADTTVPPQTRKTALRKSGTKSTC